MTIKAIEFKNGHEAIQYSNAAGGVAVLVDRKHLVMSEGEADRMSARGVEFAYLCDHEMPKGAHRIVTVPVN